MSLVINHKQWGVFVGQSMGLGFWSKLDPAGQECAPVFDSAEEVVALMGAAWDKIKDQVELVSVTPDMRRGRVQWASMKACCAAGLEMWTTDETPSDSVPAVDHSDDEGDDDAGSYHAAQHQGLRARMH